MELNSKKKNTMDDLLNDLLMDINCRKKLTMEDLLNEIQQHTQETRPKSTRSPMVNVNRPQHRYEADGSEEDEIRIRPSTSGRQQLSSNAREAALSNKYRELEKTEARLKQIEQIMRLMEEHELNGDSDGSGRQTSPRKTSNEELANSHHAINTQVPLHIRASSERPANFEPRHLRRGEASNHRNLMEGSGTDSSSGQPMSPPSICSEPQNFPAFAALQGAVAAASAQSPAYDSFSSVSSNGLKDSFLKTLQSNFDSMVAVFDNQMSPQNASAQNQMFYLMMMQNYQIMQQQQMLLYWFQQNQQAPHQTNAQGRSMNICQRCSNCEHTTNAAFPHTADGAAGPANANAPNSNGNFVRPPTIPEVITAPNATLNNQVAPGLRANNYWDNFKSNSRQNQLSANASSGYNSSASKSNESLSANPFAFNANFGGGLIAPVPQPPPPSAPLPTPNNELSFANAAGSSMPAGYNYRSSRRPKKAANATQVPQRHPVPAAAANDNSEKVQNAAVETITKQIDLSALYTVLEKFVNDESNKRESKKSKVKPNNLLPSDQQGAVGGEGVSSSTGDQNSDQYQNMSRHPLHISPSTGAIRKKPRNQEFDHAKQQSETSDEVSHNETIRPLMAAEGRSSESRPGLVMTAPPMPPSKPPSHLLLKRPPTTGANRGRDDNDDSSTTDDDLAEADQTTVEISAAEAEPIHSNNNVQAHNGHIPNLVQIQPDSSMPEDQGAAAIRDIDDDEDNMSTTEANEDGIRLSGDGEQGL